jgi:hypothetical protein
VPFETDPVLATAGSGKQGKAHSDPCFSFVEAMNGLIQAAKARARGYATDHRLITMCYLIGGKLKHLSTNPWITPAVQTAK